MKWWKWWPPSRQMERRQIARGRDADERWERHRVSEQEQARAQAELQEVLNRIRAIEAQARIESRYGRSPQE